MKTFKQLLIDTTPGKKYLQEYHGIIAIESTSLPEFSGAHVCVLSHAAHADAELICRLINFANNGGVEALEDFIKMYEEVQPAGGYQGVYEMGKNALDILNGEK
jgi:hypothetical protein